MSPPLRWARTASAIEVRRVEIRPGRSFANQSRRLAVASASGSARWFCDELDAEERRQRVELVVLEVGVALAGDHEGVEVTALLEAGAVAEGLLDEAEVEAHVVADDDAVADELERFFRRVSR